MSKINNKLNNKDIILIIVIVGLILINTIIYFVCIKRPQKQVEDMNTYLEDFDKSLEEENNRKNNVNLETKQLEEIKSKSEYERMQYYFAQYITYIENKDYEKAYSLLYPEFKDTYFPTLETYTEYVKKLYPKFVSFEYENFTRQGYVYVLTVKIIDPVNGSKEDTKTQRIILKENNFYDYVLSFQVI